MINPINALLGLFSHDVGIDLGTANTLVMVRGRGIVIDEPSVVAIDKISKKILAIGSEAKRMVGRTPSNIVAVRPLKDGVISDFEVTERMLHYFIRSVHDRFGMGIPRPRVVLGIPSGVTEVEKRAVHDAALNAGGRAVTLEFVPNDDRVSPPDQAAFAMIMLATTTAGDAYTFKQLEGMASEAGFAKSEMHRLDGPPQTVIVSAK